MTNEYDFENIIYVIAPSTGLDPDKLNEEERKDLESRLEQAPDDVLRTLDTLGGAIRKGLSEIQNQGLDGNKTYSDNALGLIKINADFRKLVEAQRQGAKAYLQETVPEQDLRQKYEEVIDLFYDVQLNEEKILEFQRKMGELFNS